MKHSQTTLMALAAALAIAGCGKQDPVADGADKTAGLPSVDNVAGAKDGNPSADGSAPTNVATAPAPDVTPAPVAAIPAALHGRWGMTPGDCTSTRGDAKGLVVIDAGGMKFYESRAVPAGHVETSKDSISADFAFTGEGQSWTKFETLQTTKDAKLVRTESSPMASFTYARCR